MLKKSLPLVALLLTGLAYSQPAIPEPGEWNCISESIYTGYCIAPSNGGGKKTETRFYTGLVWKFGTATKPMPDLVFGVSSQKIRGQNKVDGGDVSVRVSYEKGFKFDSARFSYVNGSRSTQGSLGVGYSYADSGFMLVGGAQTSHLKLGADYLLKNNKLAPYFEVNTLRKPRSANGLACNSGTLTPEGAINDYNGVYAPNVLFSSGFTCLSEAVAPPN